jgi:hypothetical protein
MARRHPRYELAKSLMAASARLRMRQQDRSPDNVAPPGRLVGAHRLGRARSCGASRRGRGSSPWQEDRSWSPDRPTSRRPRRRCPGRCLRRLCGVPGRSGRWPREPGGEVRCTRFRFAEPERTEAMTATGPKNHPAPMGQMVGATGIEPVTPTMSSLFSRWNVRKSLGFW